ncbi:uncharacterized protein LOC116140369 [Pistacia vera]|uniref:uncharacterized protein LOC116140369 n=1 Tax=Pistacia vera TaxID=55513 RepID=UPI001263ABFE|nr:uncharacterized protein LOC116140369 [Pistacia vera]
MASLDPTCYFEATKSEVWRAAMKEELVMIEKNQTWNLVDRPQNKKVIQVKWIFKKKLKPDGSVFKHKARLVVKGSKPTQLEEFKKSMFDEFEMTDLGEMAYFLRMQVYQSSAGIFVKQEKYAIEVLRKFNMENCKSVDIPLVPNQKLSKDDDVESVDEGHYRSLVGCLLYLTATGPDIMFATSLLSKFMNQPKETHIKAAKRVLRYGINMRKTRRIGPGRSDASNAQDVPTAPKALNPATATSSALGLDVVTLEHMIQEVVNRALRRTPSKSTSTPMTTMTTNVVPSQAIGTSTSKAMVLPKQIEPIYGLSSKHQPPEFSALMIQY